MRQHLIAFLAIVTCGTSGCQKDSGQTEPAPSGGAAALASPPAPGTSTADPSASQKPEAPPGETAESSPGTIPESHQFYGVYLQGQKAGWAEERVERLRDGGTALAMKVELKVQRMGSTLKLTIEDRVEYEPLPDGRLRRFKMVETQPGGIAATRDGVVEGGKLKVKITAAGATTQKTLERPKERAHDTFPALLIPRLRAAGGAALETWQYDRQNLRDIPVQSTLLGEKKTRVQGLPTTIVEVKGVDKVRGLTMLNRISESGRTLEMALGPGLKLVLEDQKIAQDPNVAVPDLYRLSAVPVDKALGTPASVNELELKFTGLPEALNLTDARQRRTADTVKVTRLSFEETPTSPLNEADRLKWTEATAFIDHQAKPIQDMLTALPKREGKAQVRAMMRTVHRALTYTLATAPLTASEILKGGRGDCTEYARLLVALARAGGLPAREVSGMAYAGDGDPGFAFHAWAEVYVGERWWAVDPTWNQVPPDATHIALTRDDPSAIVGLLGALKAEVLSIKR